MQRLPFPSYLAACKIIAITVVAASGYAASWSPVTILNPGFAGETRNDNDPSLATDGNNNWVCHWCSNQTPGLEYDGRSARSTDNGVTWSGLISVNSDAASDTGQDITPELSTDGKGTWIASWMRNVGPSTGADSDIFYARSFNNGTTWSTMLPLNSYATTDTLPDEYPHLANDGNGNWVAVWHTADYKGPGTGGFLISSRSTDNGATWSMAKPVINDALSTTVYQTIPFVATDRKGTWLTVVNAASITSSTTGFDKDIIAFRSTDNGANWSAPIVVNDNATTDSNTDEYPHIACDGRATFVVTWASASKYSPGELDIAASRSTNGGTTWSPMVAVANDATTDTRGEQEPFSAADGHGSWIVVWRAVNGDSDSWYAESKDNGRSWSNAGPLHSNAAIDSTQDVDQAIASDQKGKWLATWHGGSSFVAGAGTDDEIDLTSTTFVNPELDLPAASFAFGSLHIDSGSTGSLSVILTNTGLANLAFTGAGLQVTGLAAADFSIVAPNTSPIAPGTSRTIQVQFDPSIAGARVASLAITTNDGAQPSVTIPLSGTGTNPHADIDENDVSFGQQLVSAGPTAAHNITLRNTGTLGDLMLTGAGYAITGLNASDFSITGSPSTAPLAPGTSRTLSIVFDPSVAGARVATFAITTNDAAQPTVTIPLSGTGTNQHAEIDEDFIFFDQQLVSAGPTAARNITLRNTGTHGDLTLTGAGYSITGPHASDFSTTGSPSTAPLPPGTSRTISVVFDPSASGLREAFLDVSSDDPGAAPTVYLFGFGTPGPTRAEDWELFD